MRTKGLFRAGLAAVLTAVVGCQDQAVTAPTASRAAKSVSTTPAARAGVPGAALDRARARFHVIDGAFGLAGKRAINPDDYQCSDQSPINSWYLDQLIDAATRNPEQFWTLWSLGADQMPDLDAYAFGAPGRAQQSFGYTGEFTNAVLRTERDVKRFWDIPSADIRTVAMHGTMLLDSARVDRDYQFIYGLPADAAAQWTSLMTTNLRQAPSLHGGNHPLFTFNATSFPAYRDSVFNLSPAVVMGDGILEGYAAVGFADVAPQAIYAHEYGHQLQFAHDYFSDPIPQAADVPAEQTMYTELMADAYSAYYLTHSRGAALNRKRVAEFLQVFFQIGDCEFYFGGHHGTPNQRMRAAQFGFDVADEAQKQGHILTSAQFHDRFVAYYPTLTAPDAVAATASAK